MSESSTRQLLELSDAIHYISGFDNGGQAQLIAMARHLDLIELSLHRLGRRFHTLCVPHAQRDRHPVIRPQSESGRFSHINQGWDSVCYAAVGLTKVLSAAGVPKGSFYHYFSSEDAFGEALLKRYFVDYFADMERILTTPDQSAAVRLMGYWNWWRETQSLDECQGKCLAVKLGAEVADCPVHAWSARTRRGGNRRPGRARPARRCRRRVPGRGA